MGNPTSAICHNFHVPNSKSISRTNCSCKQHHYNSISIFDSVQGAEQTIPHEEIMIGSKLSFYPKDSPETMVLTKLRRDMLFDSVDLILLGAKIPCKAN